MDLHHEIITPNLRTTSRIVAEKFGKRHDNVLRDIQKLTEDTPENFTALNFEASEYIDSTGRALPMYELTRDGFVLLAMGFTGKAAMEWKIRFIEAFNAMEEALKGSAPAIASDLTLLERVKIARETRLMHGVMAGRRMWAMLGLPDVSARVDAIANGRSDGRDCLEFLLQREIGGLPVGAWLAEGRDDTSLNRVGLRVRDDGLYVGNGTVVFAGSSWAAGGHRSALLALAGVAVYPGSLTLAGSSTRGILVPMSVLAGVTHA